MHAQSWGRVTETPAPAAGREKPSSTSVNLNKPNISGLCPCVLFQSSSAPPPKCCGTNIKAKPTYLPFTALSQSRHEARLQSRTVQGCGLVLRLCQGGGCCDPKGQAGSSTSSIPQHRRQPGLTKSHFVQLNQQNPLPFHAQGWISGPLSSLRHLTWVRWVMDPSTDPLLHWILWISKPQLW